MDGTVIGLEFASIVIDLTVVRVTLKGFRSRYLSKADQRLALLRPGLMSGQDPVKKSLRHQRSSCTDKL